MRLAPPVPSRTHSCLFLDIDGTLLDFAPTPDQVHVDQALRELLRELDHACDGAVALVSGRSIDDIDCLFDPLCLPAAGVHGCERRDASGRLQRAVIDSGALDEFVARLRAAARPLDGILIEEKPLGIAAHYRLAPRLEAALRANLYRLAAILPPDFEILEGDHVIEVKPSAFNKATAVEAFLREAPFAGRRPVFIGDDVTDYDGFAAVRRHSGLAISVGERCSAEWRLAHPVAVRQWLEAFLLGHEAP
jgi:trehalose 6-phosphate phosphatase